MTDKKTKKLRFYALNFLCLSLFQGINIVIPNQVEANIPTFPNSENPELNSDHEHLQMINNVTPTQPINEQFSPENNLDNLNNNVRITGLALSPGDLVKITIPGIGGEQFTGDYEVNLYGYLEIPFIEPLFVQGLNSQQVKDLLFEILINEQFFKRDLLKVSVQVLQFSPITITVAGEVFNPGRVTINTNDNTVNNQGNTTTTTNTINTSNPNIPGDNPLNRYLTTALKTVGGIKPTANVEQIQIVRDGQVYKTVNLSGLFNGEPVEDIPLIAGDYIVVPKLDTFQSKLVRRSPITPDQISIYVSNLTDPGSGTSVSVSAETQSSSFEYGTRFSQALISAQCVGGNFRNENRRVLLIRTDPNTGESETYQYAINEVLTPNQQEPQANPEQVNPFVMPNDSVVCYDSELVNTETLFNLIGTFLNPISTLRSILGL